MRDPVKRKASVETLRRAIAHEPILNDNDHCSELAAKAGTYARKLEIAKTACAEARDAVLKAVEKSNSDRRPKTPQEVEEVLSPEEALAKAEQEKKERQERREKSYYWRLRKKLRMRGKLGTKKTKRN